jgi:hypothetical protein
MVNHEIVRSDVSVHDTLIMAKLKSFQKFFDIVADVVAAESGV